MSLFRPLDWFGFVCGVLLLHQALEDMLLNQERQFESLENLEDFFLMSDSSSGHSVSSPEDDDMEE